MKTKAVRLYGAGDLRLEEFELPPIREDEVLVRVVSDSICMSTYKCAIQGTAHKRVPQNVFEHPVIMGHEFAGDIVEVGARYRDTFAPGMRFALQPAINYKGSMASPGYSYEFFGGDATYCIIAPEALEMGCLFEHKGKSYYGASLAEPMSCIIGAFHAAFHTKNGVYRHEMGIREGGALAILAGAGPMGLGAVEYALHCERRPRLVAVTDVDEARLARAQSLYPAERVHRETGVQLCIVNTAKRENAAEYLRALSGGGFDDVFAMAPVRAVAEQASALLGRDGCLNFFAGPTDHAFSAMLNYYDVHYNGTHVIGTTGGNTEDMLESLRMSAAGALDPAVMVTHIGGLGCVPETTLNLPRIPGGKKLIYTHAQMPLMALDDLRAHAWENPDYAALADIVDAHNGLWSAEAEEFLLGHWVDE